MVRQADFSTGYQYIFARGIQSTSEITTFGGETDQSTSEITPFGGEPELSEEESTSWTRDQLPFIEEELKKINPEQIPDWKQFCFDMEGTGELDQYLEEKIEGNDASKYRFILGAVIYHQILYNRVLTATYSCD